jgi:hypothetical protein
VAFVERRVLQEAFGVLILVAALFHQIEFAAGSARIKLTVPLSVHAKRFGSTPQPIEFNVIAVVSHDVTLEMRTDAMRSTLQGRV